ncbi:helix-turn-helix domain-containing protein [Nonomuraea rubra]|uniref:Transcriptional regulator with XRE-family HTH domain n=1 Tax=Nonomuraea rubra TaxID=46180 RepID=A0A7X0NX33_9ACTN|nr:helix-turn-helix transcriptional regulator [Nonomuraea rubra]MBB6551210.1 transcriptional regulator with XRE-family HTH domain [Nonomuraea rubra]
MDRQRQFGAIDHYDHEQLVRDLLHRHRRVGQPTQRTLEKKSNISKSTISRVMSSQIFPSWEVLRAILLALDVDEEDVETWWKERWIAVSDLLRPLGPASADRPDFRPGLVPTQDAVECEDCGSLVINAARHREWHAAMEEQNQAHATPLRVIDGQHRTGLGLLRRSKTS